MNQVHNSFCVASQIFFLVSGKFCKIKVLDTFKYTTAVSAVTICSFIYWVCVSVD